MTSALGGIGQLVSGVSGVAGGGVNLQRPQFPTNIRTPGFNFEPGSGALSRTDPAGQLVPTREEQLFGQFDRNRLTTGLLSAAVEGLRPGLQPLQQQAAGLFPRSAALSDTLGGQLDELRPGFGRLTEARVGAVRNAASKAVGNARTAFAKRDIAGSNFAQRELASIQKDFSQQEELTRAESFVQEQEAQRQIIGQMANLVTLDSQSISTNLGVLAADLGLTQAHQSLLETDLKTSSEELKLLQTRTERELIELNIATKTIQGIQKIQADIAQAEAELAIKNQAARGESFANIFGGLGSTLFGGVGGGGAKGAGGGSPLQGLFGSGGNPGGGFLSNIFGTGGVTGAEAVGLGSVAPEASLGLTEGAGALSGSGTAASGGGGGGGFLSSIFGGFGGGGGGASGGAGAAGGLGAAATVAAPLALFALPLMFGLAKAKDQGERNERRREELAKIPGQDQGALGEAFPEINPLPGESELERRRRIERLATAGFDPTHIGNQGN